MPAPATAGSGVPVAASEGTPTFHPTPWPEAYHLPTGFWTEPEVTIVTNGGIEGKVTMSGTASANAIFNSNTYKDDQNTLKPMTSHVRYHQAAKAYREHSGMGHQASDAFAFGEGRVLGIPFGEGVSAGFPFREGESAGFPFREGESAGFPFREARQTEFQQGPPRQTRFWQSGPRQSQKHQGLVADP